jgi:hypothetical protein
MLQLYYGGQNLLEQVLAGYILEAKSVVATTVELVVASNLGFAGSLALAVTASITFTKLVLALSLRSEVSVCYLAPTLR